MNHSLSYYNRLSVLATILFLGLIILQINWVSKATTFQQNEIRYELKVLAPEIALDINALDHDAFHVDKNQMDRVPENDILKAINRRLENRGISGPLVYAIYQDSTAKVYRTNGTSYISELIDSESKACLSCIVSFSTVHTENPDSLLNDPPSVQELRKSETFQYYSPISGGRQKEPSLWFALYQPDTLSAAIKSMIGLFIFNILLLIALLYLFYILLHSLSQHKKLAQIKDDFFNNVTHEFKTPLSSIQLAAKVLEQNPSPSKKQNYINLISRESKSLENQIDRLLELSLVDSREIKFEKENIPICGLLYEIPSKLSPLIEDKNAQIRVNCDLVNHIIIGDYYHLLNAFLSLVENSLKYGMKGIQINIDAELIQDKVQIKFSDNGPGIAKEHQANIFKRFYRGQKNDEYKGNGFGIGLSYVRSTIEAHNGKISLSKENKLGTTFIITI